METVFKLVEYIDLNTTINNQQWYKFTYQLLAITLKMVHLVIILILLKHPVVRIIVFHEI
jgi:hypothetical protein